MHTLGRYEEAVRCLDGSIRITFSIDDDSRPIEELERLKGTDVSIDVEKYHKKRSGEANRFLWKLCGLLAQALGSDKDTIYILKLKEYGTFEDYEIPFDSVEMWRNVQRWRYVEKMYTYDIELGDGHLKMAGVRCWKGSHLFDTKEMSTMLNGIVQDCEDVGIHMWSDEEIESALKYWKPRKEKN